MANRKSFEMRLFRCPSCGETMYADKKKGKMTGDGHIKTMYCPYCKARRDFVQEGKK